MMEKNIKRVPLIFLIILILVICIVSILFIISLSNFDKMPTFKSKKVVKESINSVNIENNENISNYKMLKIDEGYILISNNYTNKNKYIIEKYDSNFNLLISKELKFKNFEEYYVENIVKDKSGIFVLGSVINENNKIAFLSKIDSNLNIILENISNKRDVLVYNNVLKNENNKIYLSAIKVEEKNDENVEYNLNQIIIECDNLGNLIAEKRVIDNINGYSYFGRNTILLKDNKYLFYGYKTYGQENVITKVDENFNFVWENKIEPILANTNTFIEDIAEDEKSDIYAIIRYEKESSNNCKMYIRKISKDGITLWQKEIRISNARSKVTGIKCNNGIFIQACTNKFNMQNDNNTLKPILLKYDYDGNYIWNVLIKDDIKSDTSILSSYVENKVLKIFLVNGMVGNAMFKSSLNDNYNLIMYEYNYRQNKNSFK